MNDILANWEILNGLLERTRLAPFQKTARVNTEKSWQDEVKALYSIGIGMEETLRFLYHEQPSAEVFQGWLMKNKIKSHPADLSISEVITENVLTPDDIDFWNKNGYVVLKNVITQNQCIETQNAIWDFLNATPDNPESWYKNQEAQRGLMLLFSNHPALNANRESSQIRKAYEQLYGNEKIYKTIDKVSFNPPESNGFRFLGSALHWDVSLETPIPFVLQGMLYLTDCNENDGAFHCVPGFHLEIEKWLSSLPENTMPREVAPKVLKPVAVTGNAGDFIIWHQALPHCATANHGQYPRMVQYLTYLPVQQSIQKAWK